MWCIRFHNGGDSTNFVYKNARHFTTRYSPFQLDGGQNPSDSLHMYKAARRKYSIEDWIIHSSECYLAKQLECLELAKNASHQSFEKTKICYNRTHRRPDLKLWDKVWLSATTWAYLRRIKHPSLISLENISPKQSGHFQNYWEDQCKCLQDATSSKYEKPSSHSCKIFISLHSFHEISKKTPCTSTSDYIPRSASRMQSREVVGKRVRWVSKGMRTK